MPGLLFSRDSHDALQAKAELRSSIFAVAPDSKNASYANVGVQQASEDLDAIIRYLEENPNAEVNDDLMDAIEVLLSELAHMLRQTKQVQQKQSEADVTRVNPALDGIAAKVSGLIDTASRVVTKKLAQTVVEQHHVEHPSR